MKFKRVLLVVLFSLLFWVSSFAETSIRAEIDKVKLTTDDTLTYKLFITSSEKNIPLPVVPKFMGFRVLSQVQSSTISFGKKKRNTQVVYVFVLLPREPGKLKIESSKIKVGFETYTSEEFEVEVTQGKSNREIPSQQRPAEPQEKQSEIETPKVTL